MDVSNLVPDSLFDEGSVERRKKTQGKSLWTRFVGSLNNLFNPGHDWMNYDEAPDASASDPLGSLFNRFTQAGLTGAQVAENEMSMQNAEDIYQRQVTGMQKAGLNPALMYQHGASGSAPSAPSQSEAGLSMSDLVQAVMMPLQRKMLQSQIENVQANTEKQVAETDTEKNRAENLALINQYYPDLKDAEIEEIASKIGLNLSTIDNNDANTALSWINHSIKEKENKFAEEYYRWRNEFEKAQTSEAKSAAARNGAEALMTSFEREYAERHGFALSSSSYLAIASAIAQAFENVGDSIIPPIREKLPKVKEKTKGFVKSLPDKLNSFGKRSWNRFVRFVDRNFDGWGK